MTKIDSTITQEYLKECFDYNPDTGILTWKVRPRHHFKTDASFKMMNKRLANKQAGSIFTSNRNKKKTYYWGTRLKNKSRLIHRLIWKMIFNEWPEVIDHIDGNGLNNRLSNLRNVSKLENQKNHSIHSHNTSGIMGVSFVSGRNKWESYISKNNKKINLGIYFCFFEACCARKSAEYKHGYHTNHGRN